MNSVSCKVGQTVAPLSRSLTRRCMLAAAAVAGACAAAAPLAAHAAESKGSSEDMEHADAVTRLNEVAYPDPVASTDYDKIDAIEDECDLDDDLLAGLEGFANNLTCFGLGSSETVNACLSPVSLYLALALLAQGAQGDTRLQLTDALGVYGEEADDLAEDCADLMRVLWARTTPEDDPAPSILRVANSVWMNAAASFEKPFLDVATRDFFAECFEVAEPCPEAGGAMGAWVAEHTGSTLAPAIELDAAWVASLINTVWFKDGWVNPFNEADTAPAAFHAAAGDVECDFMTAVSTCNIVRSSGYQVASLPLSTGASIAFLLPDEGVDPRSFFGRAMGVGKLFSLDGPDAERAEVTFVVPRVSFETRTDLADVCRQMGIVDAFGDKADLGAMTPDPVSVNQVEQGTRFSMNEMGIEASAYTLIAMVMSAPLPEELEQVEFRLDRPFAFRLTDPHGIVLFTGIVGDPTQE